MFERIVVPLDGSRLSARALPFATTLARQFNSRIMLVRVVSNNSVAHISRAGIIPDKSTIAIVTKQSPVKDVGSAAHAKRYLTNRAKELHDQGIDVSYHVMKGMPANSIIEFATQNKASIIVMMSHGRGRFKRAVLGSVTDALIKGGTVPVLVIRAKNIEK